MAIAVDKVSTYNTLGRNIFPISMEGCALYLPLWQGDMQGSPIISYDHYHHSCTVTGALWASQGRTFDGDDYLDFGNVVNAGVSDFSIEAWANSAVALAYQRIVSKSKYGWGVGAGNQGYELCAGDATFRFVVQDADEEIQVNGAGSRSTNTWYHVVGTADRDGLLKLYVNGVLQDDQKNISTVGDLDTTVPLRIGISSNLETYQGWNGLIGEVRIYNRLLSLAEINHNFYATKWRYQ